MDADTLTVVDTSDGCNDIIEEDLWESFTPHGFLQRLIHQGEETVAAHGVQEFLHAGERVTILLVLVDPEEDRVSTINENILDLTLEESDLSAVTMSYLMNLSKILSTHICIRSMLKPYLQSMRRKLMMNQSLSSNVSSFPSKIAILAETSSRGGIPEVTQGTQWNKRDHILMGVFLFNLVYEDIT